MSGTGDTLTESSPQRSLSRRGRMRYVVAIVLTAVLVAVAIEATRAEEVCASYDLGGRLVRVIDSQGASAMYDYDAAGNLLAIRREMLVGPVAIAGLTPIAAKII